MRRILCYGDSNTWGHLPGARTRLPEEKRWTGVVAGLLGENYIVLEDGLNGRTTVFDDPYTEYRNGKKGLGYSVCAQAPIDLLILSLGTNDLKYTDAIGSSKGLDELLRMLSYENAYFDSAGDTVFRDQIRILVISPIFLHPQIDSLRPESSVRDKYEESTKFSYHFAKVAEARNAYFMDAAMYAQPSIIDCVHMDEQAHARLGVAVAEKIREIFEQRSE